MMLQSFARGILATGASVGLILVGTAAYAAPSPDSGPVTGGTEVIIAAPSDVTFIKIAAGDGHSLALGDDGNAYTWGNNEFGQLGTGNNDNTNTPTQVLQPANVTFTQLAAGDNHSLTLGDDGNTYAWGNNATGQLGTGNNGNISTPATVLQPVNVTFTQLAAGEYHSLAIGNDGDTYAWGHNGHGQLGTGTSVGTLTPAKVLTPENVTFTQLSAGTWHSFAIGDDGNNYGWGYNAAGQLGIGDAAYTTTPTPVIAPEKATLTHFTGGTWHSAALGDDGNAYAWGANGSGQLGIGHNNNVFPPTRVLAPEGVIFSQLASGSYHSFAVSDEGRAYAWGYNGDGRLGTGNNAGTNIPELVVTGAAVITEVTFDSIPGTSLTDNGDGTWSVFTPPHAAGPVDVSVSWTRSATVQNPVVHENGFTYLAPTTAPTVTNPADQAVKAGSSASFTVTAGGAPTPSIEWEISTDGGTTWTAVIPDDGTVSDDGTTFTTTATSSAHNGYQYRATATNVTGTIASEPALLTVDTDEESNGDDTEGGTPGATGGGTGGGKLPETGTHTGPIALIALLTMGLGTLLALRRKTA